MTAVAEPTDTRVRDARDPEQASPSRQPWTELTDRKVAVLVLGVLLAILVLAFAFQWRAERNALTPVSTGGSELNQRQIDKLDAEIRQIRSDTTGSLFWIKIAALFVTVGAAVGGYLAGQTHIARKRAESERESVRQRLEFEERLNVDATYHAIVQELSSDSHILRVASAMKLGKLLQSPPVEWHLNEQRAGELNELTKQILAASLAIEDDPRVLKALSIAIAMPEQRPESSAPALPATEKRELTDAEKRAEKRARAAKLGGLDLSRAHARDAYWAHIDFTGADFYAADLAAASLRNAVLEDAQFRETKLADAVLADASCTNAYFKFADLRGANFRGADLQGARFERCDLRGANLENADLRNTAFDDVAGYDVTLRGVELGGNAEFHVDLSPEGDGSMVVNGGEWLAGRATAVG